MWNTKACRIQVKLSLICESSSICNNWQLCCLRTPGLPGVSILFNILFAWGNIFSENPEKNNQIAIFIITNNTTFDVKLFSHDKGMSVNYWDSKPYRGYEGNVAYIGTSDINVVYQNDGILVKKDR